MMTACVDAVVRCNGERGYEVVKSELVNKFFPSIHSYDTLNHYQAQGSNTNFLPLTLFSLIISNAS